MSRKIDFYDRNLRRRTEVSLSAFGYIFSECIQYHYQRVQNISELEQKLKQNGRHIGHRVLELVSIRDSKLAKREIKLMGMLQFVHSQVWRALFSRPATAIQISTERDLQYMIVDDDPLITEYVSNPKNMTQLNCAALVAGILETVFSNAGFECEVTAHNMETEEVPYRTVYVLNFGKEVKLRE